MLLSALAMNLNECFTVMGSWSALDLATLIDREFLLCSLSELKTGNLFRYSLQLQICCARV